MEYSVFPIPPEPLSWFSFLRLEVDLAVTFIQSVKLYANPKDADRALGHARKALSVIERCLENRAKYYLTEDEASLLERSCIKIVTALDSL